MSIVPIESAPAKPRLTRNQVRSFWAAWAGWTMDGMDSFIYSLVLVPALRDLLPRSGIPDTPANVGFYGGLLFALFMVGWGVALIWGPIADRFGRVRTMMFSILAFSLFTLLAAFSTGVWSLAIFRFMAGVGIGGEWSIGASLVSEDWPEERRTMGAALMHTGYYIGFLLAALANYFIGSRFGWRWMFVVGGTPALLIAFIRNNVARAGALGEKNREPRRPLDNAPRLPRAFHAALSPPHHSQLSIPDRIPGGFVGRIGLCSRRGHLYRDERGTHRGGCRPAGLLFDGASGHRHGSGRAGCAIYCRLAGPQSHAGGFFTL